jgi:5'-nucleotidase
MKTSALDISRARILVTNDDGIDAPGIKVLETAARRLTRDVWVVAPETEQSAVSHGLTIRRPLRIRRIDSRRYAVDGTPTDCVLLGVQEVMKAHRPTLVLSGVNRGPNLGDDVTYSGTVAAAMEAALLGYPAIALSQSFTDRNVVQWKTAAHHTPALVRALAKSGFGANMLYNANFPDLSPSRVKGIRAARQGRHKIGDDVVKSTDPRGQHYYWIGAMRASDPDAKGTDLALVREGWITVTPLDLDLTHRSLLKRLETALS